MIWEKLAENYVKRGEIGPIINWQGENSIWAIPGMKHKHEHRENDKPHLTSMYPYIK